MLVWLALYQLTHLPSPFCLSEIESHSIAQDSLELAVNLLPQPLGCWDSKQ